MADKAREWTDKELAKMERKIAKIYKQAEKEMRAKWEAYMLKGNKRISALEKDYTDALKVGDDKIIADVEKRLKQAKENFTFKNQYYQDMVNSVTLDMAEVNNKAREYVNGRLPEIYAKNYVQANEIVRDMQLSFTLPNEDAIKNRILEGKVKTPYMRTTNFIKIPKDQRWNTKFINSEVLQGIIQGEDMRTISKRIFPEIHGKAPKEGLSKEELKSLEKRNRQAAIRNARTLVTGAENQGKHDSYSDLSKRGIVLKQVWIATGDKRTRDWHLVMDGQERDIGEMFVDGQDNKLRYPADPQAEAATVYNCRCALTAKVIGFRNADGTISKVEDVDEGQDLHDRQIAAEVQRRKEEAGKKKSKTVETPKPQEEKKVLHGDKDAYDTLERRFKLVKIEHMEVKELASNLSEEEIIERLAGGDMTRGSCSSLCLAYCANKKGLDVLDFRGGKSCDAFSQNFNIKHIYETANADIMSYKVKKEASEVAKIIKGIDADKEYVLIAGRHASVIRKIDEKLEYLELQSASNSGWQPFEHTVSNKFIEYTQTTTDTLCDRFGCRKTADRQKMMSGGYKTFERECLLIPVDSVQPTEEFINILGYLNTDIKKQKKGLKGSVK